MQKKNRALFRRLFVALVALSPLAALTQTPPPDDEDDGFLIAAIVQAITPKCTGLTATPASLAPSASITLVATCANAPTSYEWKLNGNPLASPNASTTAPSIVVSAPAASGTYSYSMVAKRATFASASIAATVNVGVAAMLPVFVNAGFEQGAMVGFDAAPLGNGWYPYTGFWYASNGASSPPNLPAPQGIGVGTLTGGGAVLQDVQMPVGTFKINFKAAQLDAVIEPDHMS